MIAALTMLAALSASTPVLSAGTYHYTATLGGQPAGASTLTVTRDGGGTKIGEAASASIAGMQLSGTATLTLGSDLAPNHYSGSYQTGEQNLAVTVALTPSAATVVGSLANSQPQAIALATNTKHFVVIEPGLLAGLFALPAQMEAWGNAGVTAIAPIFARAEPILSDPASASARPSDIPSQDEALSIGGQVPLTIWYDPTTFVPDEIIAPSQNATITRVR